MNLVPKYARSAPSARLDAIALPELIEPERMMVPSKNSLTSRTNANGDSVPACPPAPAQTKIKPSTPCSAAFFACLTLITS